jgi:hypothetical protein
MIRAVMCMSPLSLPLQEFAHLLRCYYRLQEIQYMGRWGALHSVRTYTVCLKSKCTDFPMEELEK